MAILTDPNRFNLWAKFMSDFSSKQEAIGALTKVDLRAAVNAIDQWTEDNKVSFNTAIPLPARTALTANQKAAVLLYVVRTRYEVGA